MRVAFLTETNYRGKWPQNFPNARTEIAWQLALDAEHYNIHEYEHVRGYDAVFIIFPKATVKLNAVGVEMTPPVGTDKDITIYQKPIVDTLKKHNKKVCAVQEGPSWFFNEYDISTQVFFFNQLAECDIIFAHNTSDTRFYRGLFANNQVEVIPTLMGPYEVPQVSTIENKAIIGGNFCRWYGGFQSYIVASEFNCPIFVPSMHCKRPGEDSMSNLRHLPYMMWNEWIIHLRGYKYAVHLMPTVAAGTFSLNCAVMGIPCIGNDKVDTQTVLFPELSVDVEDVELARAIARRLRDDESFYNKVRNHAANAIKNSFYTNKSRWLEHMTNIITYA